MSAIQELMKKTIAKKEKDAEKKADAKVDIPKQAEMPKPREFKRVENTAPLQPQMLPEKGWISNLSTWFSYAKMHINSLRAQAYEETTESIIRLIESQEFPKVSYVLGISEPLDILGYFAMKEKDYCKTDLFWIFGILCQINRALIPDEAAVIAKILAHTNAQIIANNDPGNELTSYLMVISCLITEHFHIFEEE